MTQKGGRPRDLNTPGSSSPVGWVMAAANIDWRNRKRDSQAKGQGRCGKARKTLTDKQSKAQVWRRSKFQGHGTVLKRSRFSQRGVGRSTINSQASLFWADKKVRDGRKSKAKVFKNKTERVHRPDLQDNTVKIRTNCQQHPKLSQGEVRRSTINIEGVSRFKGSYKRQSRNSQFRNAPPLPVECSVCRLKLSGSAGLREHVRGSPICDLRNFILIKRCCVKIARSHVALLSANRERGDLEEASGERESVGGLDPGGGFISKQLYMEALGLNLRGAIMDDNLEEEKIEESTPPCYERFHQFESTPEVAKVWGRPNSWTRPLLSSPWNLSSSWNALGFIDIPSRFLLRSLTPCILSPKPSR